MANYPDSAAVKQWGRRCGFDLVGIAPAEAVENQDYFRRWIGEGRHGGMGYLAREPDKRLDPRKLTPGARSVICAAINYYTEPVIEGDEIRQDNPFGRVARYAWSRDYHQVVKDRLEKLAGMIREHSSQPVQIRCFVDTASLMEKPHAARAGLGWIGKNTLLLNERFGSWLALGEILTDLEFEYDRPVENRCGECRRCIEACPTGALTGPYQLDARRCIAYLTIEPGAEISHELAGKMGSRLFGCDACQEACPYCQKPVAAREPDISPQPLWRRLDRQRLLNMTPEQFEEEFSGSVILRAGLDRLQELARRSAVSPTRF